MILDEGVAWNGETYGSLSQVEGDDRHKLERPSLLRLANGQVRPIEDGPSQVRGLRRRFLRCRLKTDQRPRSRFRPTISSAGGAAVRSDKRKATLRCAVYTRVSTVAGLDYNAQRPAPFSRQLKYTACYIPRKVFHVARGRRGGGLGILKM